MTEKCKICSSTNLQNIKIGRTPLILCSDCDIYYLADFSEKTHINDYYKKEYKITSSDILDTEFRHLFRITEQYQLINEIQRYKKSPANLLDIGCDKGFFMDIARRFNYNCMGIELSEAALGYTQKIGLNVISTVEENNNLWDIAVMWHSLEHIPEPIEFLKQLNSKLNTDAYVFIRVPAFDSFWRKLLGPKWIWFQPQNHFFHYTIKSLNRLLTKSDYEIIDIGYRKPNDRITRKMYRIANSMFGTTFDYRKSIKSHIKRYYEDLTGVELFAVVKPKK